MKKINWNLIIGKYGTLIFSFILFVYFSLTTNNFLSLNNVMLLFKQMSILTIFTLGFSIVMAVGGFDMSTANGVGLVSVIFVMTLIATNNFALALLAALLVGIIVGSINGVLTAYIGLPDFIGTFAVGSVLYGIKMMLTEGNPIYVKGVTGPSINLFNYLNTGEIFGTIPVVAIVMLFFIIIAYVLMEKTKFGRRVYAIGGNKEAALYSGINIKYYKFLTYIVSGIAMAFTAILVCSRLNSAQPTAGEGYLMQAISAGYLSTTMFGEGQPTMLGTVVGAFIIVMLNNGFTMLGMVYYFQHITTGIVVILAVLMSVLISRKS